MFVTSAIQHTELMQQNVTWPPRVYSRAHCTQSLVISLEEQGNWSAESCSHGRNTEQLPPCASGPATPATPAGSSVCHHLAVHIGSLISKKCLFSAF